MRYHQKLKASDGKEVLLFPLEYMYMSQDEGGDTSHVGTYNMDFLGWGANGRVYQCPYYAPCKCKLVRQNSSDASNIWESVNPVHTPLGVNKVTIMVVHDDNLPHSVGDVVNQGDILGHTGSSGYAYGDHLHLNVAIGTYDGMEQVPPNNNWQLKNSVHIYNAMYVNGTTIIEGYNHPWLLYQGGYSKMINNFPWVLYSKKLRTKRKRG